MHPVRLLHRNLSEFIMAHLNGKLDFIVMKNLLRICLTEICQYLNVLWLRRKQLLTQTDIIIEEFIGLQIAG